MRFRFGIVLAVAITSPAWAQVSLHANKSGADIDLSWSGGTGPFDVIRATSPKMSANTAILASGAAGSSFPDSGAATDTVGLYCYIVSDVASKPTLHIATPCSTPCVPGPTTQRTILVGGTTNAALVTVNDVTKAASGGTFSGVHFDGATELPGVVLDLGPNLVTAAAKSATDDWAFDQILVTRTNGNQAPSIAITVSDRGTTAIPADGATIYDPTPQIIINYGDPDGPIDPSLLRVYINGTDKTSNLTSVNASQATYQVPTCPCAPGETEWFAGSNFIYASIQDGTLATMPKGYSASAGAHVTLSPPRITSFSPSAEGAIGAAITINGAGFDPTAANNGVKFNGIAVTPSAATVATLLVAVPMGAQTGDVVVTVDGRPSAGKSFKVIMASGQQAISSIAINASVSNHVFFTDKGSNDQLYEVLGNGSVVSRCSIAEPTGLPVDAAGNLYFGNATSPGVAGPVNSYVPGGACALYQNTRLIGESTASVVGAALTGSGATLNLYTADNDNGKIKRIDPTTSVTGITAGQIFANPCGMVANAAAATLYFSSGNNIRSIPIPGGGATSTLVKSLAGSPKGIAITGSIPGGADKLVIARSAATVNAVSWLDPSSATNPFWDLATGLTSPQAVALGSDGGGPYVVVAEPTRIFRISKPSVVLTDDADNPLPSKFVVDFASPTADCLAANVITLKVKFGPTSLVPDTSPRQVITWTLEDPDDPSPDAQVDPVDPTGTTPDNIQALGSYNQWEQVTLGPDTYTMVGAPTATSVTTEIVGGASQVKFHSSCQPGDNYRVHATVTIPVYGSIEAVSDALTVWRKLHVERDSMGVALGPFQDDDAVIGDVPDPILDFLAAAFRPAYVDVVLPPDTGADTPDVKFKYNVPSGGATIQGDLGRTRVSTSGRWVVYIQGGYEQDVASDNDPDGEGAVLGVTGLDFRNSLTFVEAIRDITAQAGWDSEYMLRKNVLHEIGHQFGIILDVGCVMTPGSVLNPVFCPDQIFTIRNADPPSAP